MLQSLGYMVLPVNEINEIQQYWTADKKQVFILDDAVGTEKLDEVKFDKLESCNSYLKTFSKNSENFIIFTCRSKVINDNRVKKSSNILTETIIDLHEASIKLSRSERSRLLDNYLRAKRVILAEGIVQLITEREYQNFPLLCRLFVSNENYQGSAETFFTQYFSVLIDELEHLKQNAKFQYVSLVLGMIYQNDFDSKLLDVFSPNEEEQKRINQIMEACCIPTNASRQNIKTAIDSLVGVYFIREGTRYRFMHETLYRAVMYQFGKEFPRTVLRICTSSFVSEYVRLADEEYEGQFIFIEVEDYQVLAERLIADIQNGNFRDVFLNPVLQDATFSRHFLKLIATYSTKQLKEIFLEPKIATGSYQTFSYERKIDLSNRNMVIQSLLEEEACTALHWLVAYNFSSFLEFLLSKLGFLKKESVFYAMKKKSKNNDKCKGLILLACLGGDVDVTQRLIKCKQTGDISQVWGWRKRSALHMAVLSRNIDMVKLILKYNIPVDINDANNGTPLRYAASLGLIDISLELINKNADVNSQDNFGRSPLFLAVKNHCEIASETKQNSDSHIDNMTENANNTSSVTAAQRVNFRVTELLLDHGANVNIGTKKGENPLCVATEYGNTDIIKLLLFNQEEKTSDIEEFKANDKMVLRQHAEVNWKTDNGETLTFIAAKTGRTDLITMFLSYGANIHECNVYGESPLFIASKNNQVDVLKLLVQRGDTVNDMTYYGETPLFTAIVNGNTDIVCCLLEYKAHIGMCENEILFGLSKVDEKYSRYISPRLHSCFIQNSTMNEIYEMLLPLVAMVNDKEQIFDSVLKHIGSQHVNKESHFYIDLLHIAVENGRSSIVEHMLTYPLDINQKGSSGKFPLFAAAEYGYTDIATKILQQGAIVNMATQFGESALYIAARNGHTDMVRVLLSYNPDTDRRTVDNVTPLFIAAENNSGEIAELLLHNSANVNSCAFDSVSPLFIAAKNGNTAIVKLLLQHGADINICTDNGESPLHAALSIGNKNIIRILLLHGVDVNRCTESGISALFLAAQNGNQDIADILLRQDSNVNQSTKNGESPLFVAVENRSMRTVTTLLQNGADVNKATKDGLTPLYVAAQKGYIDIVENLLQYHCDVNTCTSHGETPLLVAAENGHEKILLRLLQNGADVDRSTDAGLCPLNVAVANGHTNIVTSLLKFRLSETVKHEKR